MDTEWGVPLFNDRKIFEFLCLECFQAGLSWRTVLHKRKNFEKAFAGFDPMRVSRFTKKDFHRLMHDRGDYPE
jgi:DNA-3-methyladenine glycosylase I